MKKILPIMVVGFLIMSSIGAVAITNNLTIKKQGQITTMEKDDLSTLVFSPFNLEITNEYIEVNLEGVSTYVLNPGNPILPKIVKTVELPFNVRNVKVEVEVNDVKEYEIEKEIKPAPPHVPLNAHVEEWEIQYEKNLEVYESEELYPSSWYDYTISVGLNENKERATHIAIPIYPVRYSPKLNKLSFVESADIKVTYDLDGAIATSSDDEYDMVIIAPVKFSLALQKLVRHKNNYGIRTQLKTTESIYKNYEGVDKPEQIKYFIEHEISNHNIKYVLLVGGLKSMIYANPREHQNYGAKGWYVPVRYHNFYDDPEHPLSFEDIFDPGVISDLYYADVYRYNETSMQNEFNDWDPNGDGVIAAWGMKDKGYDVENDTGLDLYADVSVGRLACRNLFEVRSVVNKIINYEKTSYGAEWFKKAVMISGDGFMDQDDLDFQWDTNGLPDGDYTIIGQSRVPDFGPFGEPDIIHVTKDNTQPTNITFNHDDHLRLDGYPDEPIAEIVSISEGNILGNTDYFEEIGEGQAYGNSQFHWADINYTCGILHIRGKTYDPSPYGNVTNMHVWILNEEGETVFDDWRNDSEMYFEGEWVTGERTLLGGGGAAYYLPEDFETELVWASNGELTDYHDIINSINPGCGFAFMSGHGSPNIWSDHFPGIPGNRREGSIPGWEVLGIDAKFPFFNFPIKENAPMELLENYNKYPVTLIGGCHNSQFNVSMIFGMMDKDGSKFSWCHGAPIPECFSWYLVKMPRKGAIATIGNTGLGYGVPDKECLIEGLDGGICIEFFKQYGLEYDANGGSVILGDVFINTLQSYHDNFDMDFLDHGKSLTQWVLLGDPSLMIGGYA